MTFLFSIIGLSITLAWFIPKRITRLQNYGSILFVICLQMIVDLILDLKLNLYTYFNVGFDYETFFFILGIYPPITILLVNTYPYESEGNIKAVHIIIWSCISLILEAIFLYLGLFQYINWHIYLSALSYPIIFSLVMLNVWFMRRLSK